MTRQHLNTQFDRLITDWEGKPVEVYDSTNLYQCFDWAYKWLEYLNIPFIFPHLHAHMIYTVRTEIKEKYFEFLENTPDFVPRKGDLAVWGTAVGISGHVAVCSGEGNTNWFESYDQNWNGVQKVVRTAHNYNGIIGFLRPKIKEIESVTLNDEQKRAIDEYNKLIRLLGENQYYKDDIGRVVTAIEDRDREIAQFKREISDLKKNHEQELAQMIPISSHEQILSERDSTYNTTLLTKQEEIEKLTRQLEEIPVKEVVVEIPRQYVSPWARLMLSVADTIEAWQTKK